MLGELYQPYSYLSQADWLLVPSFHEAAPMVFDESIMLGTKVITTDTTSADEMIGSSHGIVCENSTEGIVRALLRIEKTGKHRTTHFDNEMQRRQFEELLRI